jgi:hypothetical protein
MTDFLFDIAWWVPLLVVAIGIAVIVAGNNRQQSSLRNGGLVVVLLGIAWFILSFIIETPSKLCVKQTRQIVQAVSDSDWTTFENLLDPKVTFHYVSRPWQASGKAEVDAGTKTTVKHAGLHSASAGHLKPTRDRDKITVAFVGYIDSELTPGHPIDSDWEFDFRPSGGKWLLTDLRVSRVDDTAPEGIRESLNKR